VRVLPPKAEASRSNPLDEVSDYGITLPGVSDDDDDDDDDDEAANALDHGTNALDPSPSSFEGAMGGGGRRGGSGGGSVSRAEEDPGVRADLEDAVSRLLRKEIEGVGAPDGGDDATDSRVRRRATVAGVGAREEGAGGEKQHGAKRPTVRRRSSAKPRRSGPG
jgi:hypothetical protein